MKRVSSAPQFKVAIPETINLDGKVCAGLLCGYDSHYLYSMNDELLNFQLDLAG